MSYVLAFLGFAMLIVLHEAGHFVAAKAVGMRVERFSLFFGPMVLKRRIGETEYGVGVIPLGGYVKITGMSPLEVLDSDDAEARAYHSQPVWKRVVVIGAGPGVNLVIALILAWVYFLGASHFVYRHGQPVVTTKVVQINVGSPADGKLRLGDQIISIDGVKATQTSVHDQIARHTCAGGAKVNGCTAATPATIVVRRDGRLATVLLRPRWSSEYKEMLVGIGFGYGTAANGAVYAFGQGAAGLWRVTKATVTDIVQIFKPAERKNLHSIVGVYAYTQQQIASGFYDGIQILALVSLSLAIINLFPILPLDGGHIFWALIEKLQGHKVATVTVERASFLGFALVAMMLFIGLSNDISSGFRIH